MAGTREHIYLHLFLKRRVYSNFWWEQDEMLYEAGCTRISSSKCKCFFFWTGQSRKGYKVLPNRDLSCCNLVLREALKMCSSHTPARGGGQGGPPTGAKNPGGQGDSGGQRGKTALPERRMSPRPSKLAQFLKKNAPRICVFKTLVSPSSVFQKTCGYSIWKYMVKIHSYP